MAKSPRRINSHWGMLDPELCLWARVPERRTGSPSAAAPGAVRDRDGDGQWVGEEEGPRWVGGPGPQDVGINSIAEPSVAQFSRLSLAAFPAA